NNDHEAKFPVELPRRVIQLLTAPGDVVLDCFTGSGTTAVAAAMLGRKYIGIEKEAKYVKLARRAAESILPMYRESMSNHQRRPPSKASVERAYGICALDDGSSA